jgi:hypothetical protein
MSMPSPNDLPQIREIPPNTFELLSSLVNLTDEDLLLHLDFVVGMLLAYEGADIGPEIQAISTLVLSVRQKLDAHKGTDRIAQKE